MKKLIISYCTEYEQGFGQRPDGIMVGEDVDTVKTEMWEQHQKGDREIFWRYSTPEEVWCDEDEYKAMKKRFQNGIAYVDKLAEEKFFKTL